MKANKTLKVLCLIVPIAVAGTIACFSSLAEEINPLAALVEPACPVNLWTESDRFTATIVEYSYVGRVLKYTALMTPKSPDDFMVMPQHPEETGAGIARAKAQGGNTLYYLIMDTFDVTHGYEERAGNGILSYGTVILDEDAPEALCTDVSFSLFETEALGQPSERVTIPLHAKRTGYPRKRVIEPDNLVIDGKRIQRITVERTAADTLVSMHYWTDDADCALLLTPILDAEAPLQRSGTSEHRYDAQQGLACDLWIAGPSEDDTNLCLWRPDDGMLLHVDFAAYTASVGQADAAR